MNKNIVITLIKFFGLILILIVCLLIIYYFTPNNYCIEIFDKDKFIIKKEKEIEIMPNSLYTLKENSDYYLQFINSDKINLIIKNIIKSQHIICNSENLIKLKNKSHIEINNNSDKKIIVKIIVYEKLIK